LIKEEFFGKLLGSLGFVPGGVVALELELELLFEFFFESVTPTATPAAINTTRVITEPMTFQAERL
jgi:hypothetical protein